MNFNIRAFARQIFAKYFRTTEKPVILVAQESTHVCGVTVVSNMINKVLESYGFRVVTIAPGSPFAKMPKNRLRSSISCYLPAKKYWFTFPLIMPKCLFIFKPIAWFNYWLIKQKVKKLKPVLILNHGDNQINAVMCRLGEELDIPVTTFCHTDYPTYLKSETDNLKLPQIIKNWLFNFLLHVQNINSRYVINHSDKVIMLSDYFKTKYFATVPKARRDHVSLLRNIIPDIPMNEATKSKYIDEFRKLLPDAFGKTILTCVGRLEIVKNWHFMIEVLSEIKNTINSDKLSSIMTEMPHLVYIGEGPEQEPLRQLAEQYDLSQYVHFLGRRDNEFIYHFLNLTTTICCTPSISETDGLVPKQARLCKCITIVVIDTAPDETNPVRSLSLLLDPSKWAKIILDLSKNPVRRQELKKKLYNHAVIANSSETYFFNLLTIFQEAIENHQASRKLQIK